MIIHTPLLWDSLKKLTLYFQNSPIGIKYLWLKQVHPFGARWLAPPIVFKEQRNPNCCIQYEPLLPKDLPQGCLKLSKHGHHTLLTSVDSNKDRKYMEQFVVISTGDILPTTSPVIPESWNLLQVFRYLFLSMFSLLISGFML